MFTGIVETTGRVCLSQPSGDGLRLGIDLGGLDTSAIHTGDSIAVNGVCLTVTTIEDDAGSFDVSGETLDRTLIGEWAPDRRVNLEPALTLGKPLGGHLVSGHVDGSAYLDELRPDSDSTWMRFRLPRALGRFIAVKGSVTVDGVSLTSNDVTDDGDDTLFELTLVPHTLAVTTLGDLLPGDRVHIEVDMMARYLERLLASERGREAK